MAYTSVIPVRRLDRTVDYVQNKAKTTPKSLEEAVDYAANRIKPNQPVLKQDWAAQPPAPLKICD